MEDDESLLRKKEVLARVGLGRSTLHLKISKGEFPKPIKIGPRAVAWTNSSVTQWIHDRIAASKSLNTSIDCKHQPADDIDRKQRQVQVRQRGVIPEADACLSTQVAGRNK